MPLPLCHTASRASPRAPTLRRCPCWRPQGSQPSETLLGLRAQQLLSGAAKSQQRTGGGQRTSLGAQVCVAGGRGEGTNVSPLFFRGRQGRITTLLWSCNSYQVHFEDHRSKALPVPQKQPGSSRPGFPLRHVALPLDRRAAKQQERQANFLPAFGPTAAGKSVLAPRGARRPLALPRCCCGAEITGTGKVGWQGPPRSLART